MAVSVYNAGVVCSCCALWLKNKDSTACNSTDHDKGVCSLIDFEAVINIDPIADFLLVDCDGCGTTLAGERYKLFRIEMD